MDTLVNLQAFLATADAAGFSAAARKLKVSTSVVAKRVTQLEAQIGIALFHRSTRQLRLTEAGQQYVHRARSVVADVGDLLSRMGEKDHDLIDQLRIKAPTSLTIARLADMFSVFQTENPRLKLEIVLIDRPVDPVTEGFDIAIGAFPHSFGGVVDEPLCALKRLLCASPAYLNSHGTAAAPARSGRTPLPELSSHRARVDIRRTARPHHHSSTPAVEFERRPRAGEKCDRRQRHRFHFALSRRRRAARGVRCRWCFRNSRFRIYGSRRRSPSGASTLPRCRRCCSN